MFVSIIIDPGSIDTAQSLVNLLNHTGFSKKVKSCWENAHISEQELAVLKKNIDSVTDYYDKVRIYQFPLEEMFVITELSNKKWKRYKINTVPKTNK